MTQKFSLFQSQHIFKHFNFLHKKSIFRSSLFTCKLLFKSCQTNKDQYFHVQSYFYVVKEFCTFISSVPTEEIIRNIWWGLNILFWPLGPPFPDTSDDNPRLAKICNDDGKLETWETTWINKLTFQPASLQRLSCPCILAAFPG